MPGYNTHITWSATVGVGLACVAKFFLGVSLPQAVFGGALCTLGGVLPDIDSDQSRAYQRSITTISGTCALLLASRLRDFNLESEGVVTICATVYFSIVYIIGKVIEKLTVHRGMCHSVPFAIITGEIIFILSSGNTNIRLFKASAIILGVLIHLILDEIFSVDIGRNTKTYSDKYNSDEKMSGYKNGNSKQKRSKIQIVHIKNSFGTALKFIDYKHMKSTIVFYVAMAFLGHCAMGVQDFLASMGDIDQAAVQGRVSIERVKHMYPTQYDLSVVQWIADNDFVLSPGQDDNAKWKELEELLSLGENTTKKQDSKESKNKITSPKTKVTTPEEGVSLLDVINWNSINTVERVSSGELDRR